MDTNSCNNNISKKTNKDTTENEGMLYKSIDISEELEILQNMFAKTFNI